MTPNSEQADEPESLTNWRLSQLEDAMKEFRAESRRLYWTLVAFMIANVALRFLV